MIRSSAHRMLPMLMPALTALLRDVTGCGGDVVEGFEGLGVDEFWMADDGFVAEEVVEAATDDKVGVVLVEVCCTLELLSELVVFTVEVTSRSFWVVLSSMTMSLLSPGPGIGGNCTLKTWVLGPPVDCSAPVVMVAVIAALGWLMFRVLSAMTITLAGPSVKFNPLSEISSIASLPMLVR